MSTDAEVDQVQEIVRQIHPLLAGVPPALQGAVLADLLATFLAGHFKMGDATIERVLTTHVSLVRRLVPPNVEIIRRRYS